MGFLVPGIRGQANPKKYSQKFSGEQARQKKNQSVLIDNPVNLSRLFLGFYLARQIFCLALQQGEVNP